MAAAPEDSEYKKLSTEERCVHKLWKARVDGYEEATKLFREIDDDKSPEWSKYVGVMKKVVVDSNAMAQEKGLEATLAFVENCGHAGKTVGDVMSGIVQKCIAAPKTKTKELAVQVTLMYIEIEKHEAVIEELIKGMDHKNPKIIAACVAATTLALHEFGNKVVNVKPLIKKLAPLMSDRDKVVRDEGKQLAIEIYRWIGAAMKAQIATLPQVTIKELEDEFEKLKGEKPEPNRYLKSQQEKHEKQLTSSGGDAVAADEGEDGETAGEEIDPMDLLDPVDILSKIPKDFYEKLDEKKWTLRKEALEALEKLLSDNPKLESGDYGAVVNALKKIITKDTNVVLVALGGKCLAMLAKGLGKRFSPYAMACIPALLEKFKEKKTNVVTALRDAMDAIYPSTSLEAMQECIVESLGNKNPSVKSETASFLARAFAQTQPTALNKKLLKLLVTTLLKTLNESDPTVRDCSAEALGTLMKLLGEKTIGPFLADVDALKMAKIKESHDKVEIKIKLVGLKKERPSSAPASKAGANAPKGGSTEPKAVTRPATAGAKKASAKRPNGTVASAGSGSGASSGSSSKAQSIEREMSPEEVLAKTEELLPSDIVSGLVDSNWKTRLAAVENLSGLVTQFEKMPGLSQILIRTVGGRKPGLKQEMNFQVLKIKLDIIRMVAETYPLTTITVDVVINDVTEKLADIKNGNAAADVLTAFAEATKFDYVVGRVLSFAFEQKSPKVQSESLNWVNKSILEFGFQLQPKLLIDDVRKAVQSTNPLVRSAAIGLVGTMTMYMGNALMMFFENEKSALKAQIQTEFDKKCGEKPPKPTRGTMKSSARSEATNDSADADDNATMNVNDLLPRVDISTQITDSLLREMSDKDWKTRNEGLNKLQAIITEAKLIKPLSGDLTTVLALRLLDSNAKIAQTALAICDQLACAMGAPCKGLVRTLFPGILHALGDNKSFVRAASLNCIRSFGENGGYKEFFEGEMIADALKTGSPALKAELWGWLAERLPVLPVKSISKEELSSMIPHLYAQICDRNVDVRKNANDAVLGLMIHLGYEVMAKASDKQKPAAKKDIQAALEKARPNLPVKPLPKGKQQAPVAEEVKKVVRGGGGAAQKAASPKNSGNEKATTNAMRKKEEETESGALLPQNSAKNQRLIDEQKMRVLKWSFTTPREEFTELLRDQMNTAGVNKALMANMFHDDFRYHLKVIEALSDDLASNNDDSVKSLMCNLDLILKWLSLRFYDTNPSVLIKGLEYLNEAFKRLVEKEYIMAENEGCSFIPHLLLKLGDPKDTVRNGVRTLLRQILLVFPFTKVFVFVMEGLKSKNARQRTECLDELGFLIESYGLAVCQPSQQVALKEIARHISDRDNSVRNAALNCIVQAYFLTGEKIYKLIGQLSDKELSMLDERIKRAKKTKKVTPPAEPTHKPTIIQQESIEIDEPTSNGCDELPPPDEEQSPQRSQAARASKCAEEEKDRRATSLIRQATFDQPPSAQLLQHMQTFKSSGPFGLNPDVIADIEKGWVHAVPNDSAPGPRVDISVLFEPIRVIPTRDGIQYPQDKFDQLVAHSHKQAHTTTPPKGLLGGVSPYMSPQQQQQQHKLQHQQQQQQQQYNPSVYGQASSHTTNLNLADVLPKHDPNLVRIITRLSSSDAYAVRGAIIELTDIIESTEKQAVMRDYEEIFIQNVVAQLKKLAQQPLSESLNTYQPLLSITYAFFHTKILGKMISVGGIMTLMHILLNLMAEQKFASIDDQQYTKVINGICLRILDTTNFTNLNCALIRLLRETCPGASLPKFTELLMKCIWRNVKILPERGDELNYDAVILEVHEFMLALPSTWWATRPSDTPLRTIKTIIHNMAKLKGNSILQHLNNIPTHSELHSYLLKILKNLQRDGSIPTSSPQRSSSSGASRDLQTKRISNQAQETMMQIFKLISEKETKQQGLQKLYEFKVKNPDIDISAFLKGATPSFLKFIEDGLSEIERVSLSVGDNVSHNLQPSLSTQKLNMNFQNQATSAVPCPGSASSDLKVDPDFWMDRLNHLRARANLAPHGNAESNFMGTHLLDNKVADENLNLNAIHGQKVSSYIRKDVSALQRADLSPNRLQHIQAKLAQIKKDHNT